MTTARNPYVGNSKAWPSQSARGGVQINVSAGDQELLVAGRGVHIDTAGSIKVEMEDGSVCAFQTTIAGLDYSWQVVKIFKSGTTATGFVLI